MIKKGKRKFPEITIQIKRPENNIRPSNKYIIISDKETGKIYHKMNISLDTIITIENSEQDEVSIIN